MQDLLAGARTILARADETLQTLEQTVSDNSDDISLAVLDVRKFTSALAENSDEVGELVANVSTAATSIADATTRLDGIVDKSEALIAAIDPEEVRQTLANIRTTSDSFAAQAGRLGAIMDRADAVAADAQAFSRASAGARRQGGGAGRGGRSGEGQPHARQLDRFTTTLGENSDDIDQIVADAQAASRRASSRSASARTRCLTKLDSMAGQGPGGIIEDATETLAAIRAAADNFNAQVSMLGGGLGDFSDRGLRDFQSLVTRGTADDRPARPRDLEPGAESDRLPARRRERAGIWRAAAVGSGGGVSVQCERHRRGGDRRAHAGVAALLLAAALAGCASLVARRAERHLRSDARPASRRRPQRQRAGARARADDRARARHRPHRRAARRRREYAYLPGAVWSDRLPKLLQTRLVRDAAEQRPRARRRGAGAGAPDRLSSSCSTCAPSS